MNQRTKELIESYSDTSESEGFKPIIEQGIFTFKLKCKLYTINLEIADKIIDKVDRFREYCNNLKAGDEVTFIKFYNYFCVINVGIIKSKASIDTYRIEIKSEKSPQNCCIISTDEIIFEGETKEQIIAKAKTAFVCGDAVIKIEGR